MSRYKLTEIFNHYLSTISRSSLVKKQGTPCINVSTRNAVKMHNDSDCIQKFTLNYIYSQLQQNHAHPNVHIMPLHLLWCSTSPQ